MARYQTDTTGRLVVPDVRPEKRSMISAIILVIITIFIPPVGVFLIGGCGADLFVNICLTILGYFPGHIHAFYLEYVYYKRREESAQGIFDNRPAPAVYSDNIQTGGRGYVERWCLGAKDNRGRGDIEMEPQDPKRGASDATRVGSQAQTPDKPRSRSSRFSSNLSATFDSADPVTAPVGTEHSPPREDCDAREQNPDAAEIQPIREEGHTERPEAAEDSTNMDGANRYYVGQRYNFNKFWHAGMARREKYLLEERAD